MNKKYDKSKYSRMDMMCITMFYLVRDKKVDIHYLSNLFEFNDIQKMYKIISAIRNALIEFGLGYYVKFDKHLDIYHLIIDDDDG